METENKRKRIKVGGVVIAFFLLLYIPSLVHWISGNNIITEVIRIGTIEDSINTDAYFVRNEEVIKSPFSGKCIMEVAEGEKIAANTRVAMTLNASYEKLLNDLDALDLKILEMQKEKNNKQDIFSEDVVKIDNEIGDKLKLAVNDINNNSLLKMKQLKDGIDELIQKKAVIIGNTGTADAYLTSKKQERAELQEQINRNKREIVSKSPGIISYSVDGYETILYPDMIKDITPEFLEGIKSKVTKKNINNMNVEAGKPFAKVIKDIECSLVMTLDEEKAKSLKVDDRVEVRMNDIGKLVDGTVFYKSNKQNGKYIVGISIYEGISETAAMRKVNCDIIRNSHTGLKVPLSSLRNIDYKDMKADIVLVKGNYASVREVKIAAYDGDEAIIMNADQSGKNGVGLYDTFVVNSSNIQEGQMIYK